MEIYDLAMLALLIGATVFGASKGMAWQIASISSLVVSYFVALRFSADVAPYISTREPWNRFLAMLVLYLATSLAIWFVFRAISGLIDRVQLKEFDRQVGGLMGFAKGVLLCIAVTFFALTLLEPAGRERVLQSRSGHYIALLLDQAHAVMPPELHDVLEPYFHRLRDEFGPTDWQDEHSAEEGADDIWDYLPDEGGGVGF